MRKTGGVLIPPYNHRDIIAGVTAHIAATMYYFLFTRVVGQGTLALELLEQVRDLYGEHLDAIIVPVGGGGLVCWQLVCYSQLLLTKNWFRYLVSVLVLME